MKTATLLERKHKLRKAVPLDVLPADGPVGASARAQHTPHHAPGEFARAIPDGWQPVTLAQVRAAHIESMLEYCNGNRVRAAERLGIGRTSLYRFLKRQSREKGVGNGE